MLNAANSSGFVNGGRVYSVIEGISTNQSAGTALETVGLLFGKTSLVLASTYFVQAL